MKRVLLVHLDDVGLTSGSILAWKKLREAGVATSASVMVPCPWYRKAVDDWHAEPKQDLGIHLTLTSEWSTYRWRPLIGISKYLCDDEGFFHKRTDALLKHCDKNAIRDELQAQIERVLMDGIKPTHLDSHMGAIYLDPYIDIALELSAQYKIPLFFCRNWSPLFDSMKAKGFPSIGKMREVEQELILRKNPIFDDFLITFPEEPNSSEDWYRDYLSNVKEGKHWLALHATEPGELKHFATHHEWARESDFYFYSSFDALKLFEELKFQLVNFKNKTL